MSTNDRTMVTWRTQPYTRILVPDAAGGYTAELLEFPGCVAAGETAAEAIHALERASESRKPKEICREFL